MSDEPVWVPPTRVHCLIPARGVDVNATVLGPYLEWVEEHRREPDWTGSRKVLWLNGFENLKYPLYLDWLAIAQRLLIVVHHPELTVGRRPLHPAEAAEQLELLLKSVESREDVQVLLNTSWPETLQYLTPEQVTLCYQMHGQPETVQLSQLPFVVDQYRVFTVGEIWPAEESRIIQEAEALDG